MTQKDQLENLTPITGGASCEPTTNGSACCTPVDTFVQTVSNVTFPTAFTPNGGTKKLALPVAIIGGGPIGLAAAAQLHRRGEPFVLFEAGESVGSSIWSWRHVRIFSPWQYSVDEASVELLEANGWQAPPSDGLPTGQEIVDQYLQPLANVPELKPHIQLNSRVRFVGRKGLDKMKTAGRDALPFVLHVEQDGTIKHVEARAVIDASGTWANPNPVGSGGVAALGEETVSDQIMYTIPDILGRHKHRYAEKRVLVVGSGHSAMNTLLELLELKDEFPTTEIFWALRKEQMQKVYGGESGDALPARGALGSRTREAVESNAIHQITPFHIHAITQDNGRLQVMGMRHETEMTIADIDEIVANTGARPDLSFLREVRMSVDPALESVSELAELIDPNIHSCGTVRPHGEKELRQPEKDFYIVGMKSYGRAPTFLMATGYEQVRSVAAALANDWDAAAKVQLNLPETGVCETDFALSDADASAETSCCAPASVVEGEVKASCC
ncbi:MAG: NAD(P)-binding domain-containing protein [Chloroflexota bacterium]